jgi:hypothetical protein
VKTNQLIPGWAWRGSIVLLCGALLVTLGLLAATLVGIADPQPSGVLTVEDTFANADRWHLASDDGSIAATSMSDGHYEVSTRVGSGQLIGVWPDNIECPCTVELRAMQTHGGQDAGYGLWWGDTDHRPAVRVGVNSDGYLGILSGDGLSGTPVRDWQLFPHVRSLGQINVFRADIDERQVTVRLNDEVATQLGSGKSGHIPVGFFVGSSLHNDSTFRFLSFKVWETRQAYTN